MADYGQAGMGLAHIIPWTAGVRNNETLYAKGLNMKRLGLFMNKTFSGKAECRKNKTDPRYVERQDRFKRWRAKKIQKWHYRLDWMASSFPIMAAGNWMRAVNNKDIAADR